MAEGQESLRTISANTTPTKAASTAAKSTASYGTRAVSQDFIISDAVFVVLIAHLEQQIRANSVSKTHTLEGQVSPLSVNQGSIATEPYVTKSAKPDIKVWGQCVGSDVPTV